jgi:hypothetical protein
MDILLRRISYKEDSDGNITEIKLLMMKIVSGSGVRLLSVK